MCFWCSLCRDCWVQDWGDTGRAVGSTALVLCSLRIGRNEEHVLEERHKNLQEHSKNVQNCTNIHSDFPSIFFFPHNVALYHWNTNKQKVIAGWAKLSIPWIFGEVTLPFLHEHPWPAAGAHLAVQLTCPCVPSAHCPHHQGRGLHGVLGHGHRPLARWLGISGVLHPGVLPTALTRRRGSQVSAAVASATWSD